MDFPRFIEQLKDKNDIVDVVSKYVSLERKGNRFWGKCPFHHDKTPSFAVNVDGQFYHCFGCGASGDVIKFLREMESLDFMEAVELLCKRAGMKLPQHISGKDADEAQKLKKRRDRLYALLKDAAKFYHACLKSKGQKVVEYLHGRGISGSYIVKFGLGYSPDAHSLIDYLAKAGYTGEEMAAAGVAAYRESRPADPLAGRLIIPIITAMGDVVAFGCRDMRGTSPAKYKNTAESEVFTKSRHLFGLNLAKKFRPPDGGRKLIIVEGYMDAIALHQAGFGNAVANMGTSLTRDQAKLIKRYCDDVYICYDGDTAGQAATLRGLDILRQAGLGVKVVSMPADTDPDEYIRKEGVPSFEKLVEQALPLPDFKIRALSKNYNLGSADGKRKYTQKALEVIAAEDNASVREELLKQLRDLTGISYDSLKRDLEGLQKSPPGQLPFPEPAGAPAPMNVKAARFMLCCMLSEEEYATDYDLLERSLAEPAHIKVLGYIKECRREGRRPRKSAVYEISDDEAENLAILECGEAMTEAEKRAYYADCLKFFRLAELEEKLKIVTAEFEREQDNLRRKDLVFRIQEINSEIKKIKRAMIDKNAEKH